MKKITLFLVAMTMSLLSFAQSQMSGTYTVGTGGSYDYSSMADAGMAIKDAEFTGDVTLLICTDLTETINTGIVNKSEYTLTIRPDKDENRTITYTTAKDNTGPTGVFVIGGDMTKTPGTTIGWASVPTKNVIVDGAAEGKTTPRLKITNNKWGTNVLLYGDVQDVIIRNCILVGRSGSSTAYSLAFRSENYSQTSKNIGPKNCVAENCIIESASTQSQVVYCQGNQANSYAGHPTNITIRNCSITSHLRGAFLYGVNGMNIEGCTFNMLETSSGYMCHGILGTTVKGKINVKGNKFIKNTTNNASAGEFGLQTITASGGADVWVIENNYFAGYDALASGTTSKESRLVGIRCGDYCVVRHNTFHMPKLTYAPGTSLVGTHAVALLWLAGSHKYPVQNNIFVCEETTANVSLIRGGLNENVTGNVFYHKGGNAAIVAAAPSCMTFVDLETSYPAQAATSKWTNVTFTDVANGDLSLAGASDGDANLAVDRLAEVLTDIEGKTRAERTYAGAYEAGEFPAEVCTVTANANPIGGGIIEGAGVLEKGSTVTLTATPSAHYDFVNWTEDGEVVSTTAEYSFTVTKDIELTANFQEHAKYTITASAADNTMGYVTGGGTYYAGETVTLTAVAKSTYYFVNWSDGNTNATRTFPASANLTLTANFAKANPRAWAYDLKMVEEGDNYKFSFTATTAANATLLFLDKEGNELYVAHDIGAVAAGANTVSIEKAYFTQVKDVYWSVKMDGEAITAVAEITDQSRGIYDFYSTLGVTVDNNPNSEYFGKVYVQATLNGGADGATTRADEQMAGLFIYNQWLDELNPTSNVGIQPSLPAGYGIGGTNQFNRLAIDPITNNITYCYAISGQPAVFSMDRANLTGTPANLLAGQSGITRSVAHCFDTDGALYVMDLPGSGTIYKIKDGVKTQLTETTNKFVNPNITMTSDGRGGLWVSQNRGQMDGSPYYYQLAHVTSAGAIDWAVNKQTPHGFEGGSSRGALAYDSERQILAQGRNGKVELYTVSYEPTITLTPLHTIASDDLGNNIDGLAFDFAGDLYVVNSSKEKFQKFTLPTAENICTVSAPESQAIIKEVRYTITVNTVGNGTATGAGAYVAGETATLEASPAAHHQFVNWIFDDETTSTDNPLELVVHSDITVTAHFEPIQYTVVALTNDESKGTVTGAGTYDYGTEATLTATPEPGYKLLYWSDRSTENPRNITMTKNEALSAYFVKEYVVEPTFTIEKVWENTNVPGSAAGYQAVGWDGKIYMQNKTEGKIKVYNNGTDAAVDYAASNTSGQQIAVDEVGNLIVFNATFYSINPNAIQIYKNGSTTAKAISFTLPHPERCDFISASGDIYSAEGGYVYFYCQNKNAVNRVKITNGELASVDAIGNTANPATSVSHVMVDIFGNLAAHCRSTAVYAINSYTGETTAFNASLSGIKLSTLGGCSFELGGKEFWAYNVGNTHYNSEWNLYNMTDKQFISGETLYAKDKVSKKNTGPANWLNVQVVDENTAYIYQFCPEVAVAVWKVTMHEVVLRDTVNNEDLLIALNGSTTNVSVYRSLTGGMYNTLCLPFDVNDLTGTPLENATIWQYNGATVKGDGTSKEIFLDFAEVTSITAGEPYLVEPAEDIAAPMEFKNVTISVTNGSEIAPHTAVTMHGILHPTELQANNKSILFLVENNNLAWANETANMNGMRAYFKVNEPSLLSARTRAYIRREPTVATDMENITTSETEIKKVIYNGTLYIIRGDEVYTIQGTKVK